MDLPSPHPAIMEMLSSINTNLASQAHSLKELSEDSKATNQSLQYTQAEVAELQDSCSSLELENKALMLKQAR